jgi:hypothetical protein
MHLISVFRDNWGCIGLVVDAGAEDVVVEADIGLIGSPGEVGLRSEIHVGIPVFRTSWARICVRRQRRQSSPRGCRCTTPLPRQKRTAGYSASFRRDPT